MKTHDKPMHFDADPLLRVLQFVLRNRRTGDDELKMILAFADQIDLLAGKYMTIHHPNLGEFHSARTYVESVVEWETEFGKKGCEAANQIEQ